VSSAQRELAPLKDEQPSQLVVPAKFYDDIEDATRTGSKHVRADVLSAALVLGKTSEVKGLAAKQIEESDTGDLLRQVTQAVVGIQYRPWTMGNVESVQNGSVTPDQLVSDIHKRIAHLRLRSQFNPKNGFTWVDMALLFETLGQSRSAERAMKVAMLLYPNSRHVLRANARMLVHRGEYEQAHAVVSQHARTRHDPWLLATAVTLSHIQGHPSGFSSIARHMLRDNDFSPFHLGELASAMGTAEIQFGNERQARRWLRQATEDPNENVVAQNEWAVRTLKLELPTATLVRESAEALAHMSYYANDLENAAKYGLSWLSDQPFSSRPAQLSTFVMIQMNRHAEAAAIANFGLRSNPGDVSLLNNYAYALASDGKPNDAMQALDRLPDLSHDGRLTAVTTATRGFAKFRSGDHEIGTALYRDAISRFIGLGQKEPAAVAWLAWIAEKGRADGGKLPAEVCRTADTLANSVNDVRIGKLQREIQKMATQIVGDVAPDKARSFLVREIESILALPSAPDA
jgi:Tfp pilus assembly protein PilF